MFFISLLSMGLTVHSVPNVISISIRIDSGDMSIAAADSVFAFVGFCFASRAICFRNESVLVTNFFLHSFSAGNINSIPLE